jgi:hypothetical protein
MLSGNHNSIHLWNFFWILLAFGLFISLDIQLPQYAYQKIMNMKMILITFPVCCYLIFSSPLDEWVGDMDMGEKGTHHTATQQTSLFFAAVIKYLI